MKIFLSMKTAGSAQKLRVGRVSGNTAIFCLGLKYCLLCVTDRSKSILL